MLSGIVVEPMYDNLRNLSPWIHADRLQVIADELRQVGEDYVDKNPDITRAMRAVAENRATARLIGVNAGRLSAIAWGIGGLIAAVTVMLQAQSSLVSTITPTSLIIYGFVAATMGGFTSLIGTFVGGLILGVIQQFVGAYLSTAAQFSVALLVVFLVLVLRPDGFTKGVRLRDV